MPPSSTRSRSAEAAPLVTFVLHKFSRGGSDRVAAHLARGFLDAGFRVELVVFVAGGEVEGFLLDLLGPARVHFLGRPSRWRAADLVKGLPAFAAHLRRSRPDVVLSTANNTALISALGCLIARLRGTRLVLKTTNPIASSRHRGLVRQLRLWSYRRIFRHTAEVWTLSEEESAEMRAEFAGFETLFRSVAQPYVTAAMARASRLRADGRPPTVLSIARLTSQKRLDRLIRAFAHVKTPGARLLILGEGEERASLEALARRLGVAGRVSMPGYRPDVAGALEEADVLVLTSDYEGLPAAVLEAMAAGCPVISTDCFPSARSLLARGEACALIEDLEPRAIAAQIDRTLEAPRPTNLHAIASAYSIEEGVASHLAALRSLLGTSDEGEAPPAERMEQ